jgi:streptogramin lyase
MNTKKLRRCLLLPGLLIVAVLAGALVATYMTQQPSAGAAAGGAGSFTGKVQGAGSPIAGSAVTLYSAGEGKPMALAKGKTGDDGTFNLDIAADKLKGSADKVLYLVARGGMRKAEGAKGPNDAIALLSVLGPGLPKTVTVNEFTTLASVWTGAQFLEGDVLSGPKLGLRIAAGNVPNFVDLQTGGYGDTIQNSLNSGQTPTMANFATLANVLAGAITQIKPDATKRFLAAATPRSGKAPTDTLTALAGVARDSGYKAERLFALLDEFYPVPKGKNLRPVPFMPYLSWAPSAWVLPLKFDGGGLSAPGKMMFDSQGNLWAGNNFIVGLQNQDAMWAGNLSKFAPNGRPLSPMTTGYAGGGLQGVGFGLAIDAEDNVWATCYAGRTIVKFDKSGKPLSPPEGYNFGGQLGLMQGIIVTPSGDVWACDVQKSQMVYIPKGDPSKGKLLFQNKTGNPKVNPGKLSAPFHLAIDQQDRIWVSNFVSDWVTRFPVSDPTKVEVFKTGFSPGGMGIDSKGNVWIASHFGNSKRGPAIFAEVMKVAKAGGNYDPVLVRAMVETKAGPEGGCVTILCSDGSEVPGSPVFRGGGVVPWAIAVDGNDHVWVSNFSSSTAGIAELAGCRPEANPPGLKMGEPISPPGGYVGGGMQMLVDIDIDPAGNVWVGNNWNNYEAALGRVAEALQTQGAGQGVVCFYGMAKPVRTPLIGPAQTSR